MNHSNRDPKNEMMEVFGKLPNEEQNVIKQCWAIFGDGAPNIIVGSKEELAKAGVHSPARTHGATYWFRAELFDAATPSDVLHSIIAHELAHAFDAITAFKAQLSDERRPRASLLHNPQERAIRQIRHIEEMNRAEPIAAARVAAWKFDQEKAMKWCAENLP
jgi:hypothetical protein